MNNNLRELAAKFLQSGYDELTEREKRTCARAAG